MSDLGLEGELGIGLALVGGGEQVGPGDPPAQSQRRLHQHLQKATRFALLKKKTQKQKKERGHPARIIA